MKYILVRHVETTGNVERRLNGHTESDYTPRGLKMKDLLVEELTALHQKIPFDAIYASPISRAHKIGVAVAQNMSIPLVVDERLKEFNFGVFDGLTADEAIALDKETWEAWMADYNHVTLPQGDNYGDYHNRLKVFLDDHAEAHAHKNVLIVAHGGTVHSLLVNLLDLPLAAKWHFNIKLGSITIIDCPQGFGMLERMYEPDYEGLL